MRFHAKNGHIAGMDYVRFGNGTALTMYPQWGHGLYDEEKGFNGCVLDFLGRETP